MTTIQTLKGLPRTLQTLRGFRDFLPEQALKRAYVVDKIRAVFERFGFDPLETPALEYEEVLRGKYGAEGDKLMYRFTDAGGRNVALRYDQTVPLARVVAQYRNALPIPFKRYQIQPVWRAENPQKGRFREFLQCDIDSVGTASPLADAEIIDCALGVFATLGFSPPVMRINDRTIFDTIGLKKQEIIVLDKLAKIGKDAVVKELITLGRSDATEVFDALENSQPTERLGKIFETLKRSGYTEGVDIRFDPFLARGLDYYTSTIFELSVAGYSAGSLAGGGRYDGLIGTFTGNGVPAVGIAFGFDRILEAMEELNFLPLMKTVTRVLVAIFSQDTIGTSLEITKALRKNGIQTEMYPDGSAKLDKQLKYADRKGIPYVLIQGPDEKSRDVVVLKSLSSKTQKEVTIDQVIQKLTNS